MGEVVNLRRIRKAKRRADAEAQATANRVAFGGTKSEKAAARREAERRERDLYGAKRED